jgi:lipopolysaccharide export system permease protein
MMLAEDYLDEKRVIIARSVDITTRTLSDLTILFTDKDNNFLSRIDAKSGVLKDGELLLHQVRIFTNDHPSPEREFLSVKTALSIGRFTEGFVSPEHVSFWQLRGLIDKLKQNGMSVSRYQIYYYKQLFKPLMVVAAALMATCFTSMRQYRNSGVKSLAIGIGVGFAIYLLSEICVALLTYRGLDPAFAALCPILTIVLISNFVILHLHETG